MITLNASGSSVTFTFDGNSTYLNDGTIEVPKNSLALIIDESDMITFRKSASNDIFVSANIAEFGMTKDELIAWYKANMVGSTGGGGGVTSGEVQTMIDESISGKADTDSLSAYTINEGIASSSQTYVVETPPYGSPSSIVNTLDNSYEGLRVYKVDNYSTCYLIGYDENDTEIGRITFSSENPTIVDTTGFTDVIINRERISDSASTAIVEGKELTAIKKFSFYNNYWATDEETSVYFYNKAYNVTDAVRFDFAKKADGINVTWGSWPELYITLTSGERTITGVAAYFDSKYFRSYYDQYDNHLLSIKESVFQDYAKTSAVTEEISAAVSGKQDTLIAGRGISITTGETADTISVSLSISAGTGSNSIAEGSYTTARGNYSHAEGQYAKANGDSSHAEGFGSSADGSNSHAEGMLTVAKGHSAHAEGNGTRANNQAEHASGLYNVCNSASTTFGNSGNTLFSVGNGTADNARHNAFEIRQNGDIYCSDGTNDVKLQDTITATAANTSALGGLNLVKLTESEYAALVTKDPDTLYVVIPDTTNP